MSAVLHDAVTELAPHVHYGDGEVRRLPSLVRELGAERVLLVCGRRSFERSGAAMVLPDLEAEAEVVRFSDYSPNTSIQDVERGLVVLRRVRPDLVLAVGGGSSLDLAKLLCAFEEVSSDLPATVRAAEKVISRRPGLVLVPTTSGSGSEATHFAVVYVDEQKHSIAGPGMLPDQVVLDPELTRSGPAHVRATSGIDAVCQAIESMWAVGGTSESREHARLGLALSLDHLEAFVDDPQPEAARGMCLGSHFAGCAINISKTTAAHALSYALTLRHGITHGHAVALTLGHFIEAHVTTDPHDLQPDIDPRVHEQAMKQVLAALGASDGPSACERFQGLLSRVGLDTSLSSLGVPRGELADLAASVNVERLGNNPVVFDHKGLTAILRAAF